MDEIRRVSSLDEINTYINQAKETQDLSPDFLLVILGPTASGKTKLAVQLAQRHQGEIISADSRQIYKGLDIGTGKDLTDYETIPYHLIDIRDPKNPYSINSFRHDFAEAYRIIRSKKRQAILCGGTGSYIQAVLQDQPYSRVPTNKMFHEQLDQQSVDELRRRLQHETAPADFSIDFSNKKRIIRALEIITYLKHHPLPLARTQPIKEHLIIGINPHRERRRTLIDERLTKRLDEGLIKEVESLLMSGLSHHQIQWFGLEYKYVSFYLNGKMTYHEFTEKLRTEIHRFAKRQMTYFRKMEKDGLPIQWFPPLV